MIGKARIQAEFLEIQKLPLPLPEWNRAHCSNLLAKAYYDAKKAERKRLQNL